MRWRFHFLLLALPSSVCEVVMLDGDNFSDEMSSSANGIFVKFYAPWCGHCKKLKPTWDELAQEQASRTDAARVGLVDCTRTKELCTRHAVRAYPTLLFFGPEGKSIFKYFGARTIEALTAFADEGWQQAEEYDPSLEPPPKPPPGFWELARVHWKALAGVAAFFVFLGILGVWLANSGEDDEAPSTRPVASTPPGRASRSFGNVPLSEQSPDVDAGAGPARRRSKRLAHAE